MLPRLDRLSLRGHPRQRLRPAPAATRAILDNPKLTVDELLEIAQHLDCEALRQLARTSAAVRALMNTEGFWADLGRRKGFGDAPDAAALGMTPFQLFFQTCREFAREAERLRARLATAAAIGDLAEVLAALDDGADLATADVRALQWRAGGEFEDLPTEAKEQFVSALWALDERVLGFMLRLGWEGNVVPMLYDVNERYQGSALEDALRGDTSRVGALRALGRLVQPIVINIFLEDTFVSALRRAGEGPNPVPPSRRANVLRNAALLLVNARVGETTLLGWLLNRLPVARWGVEPAVIIGALRALGTLGYRYDPDGAGARNVEQNVWLLLRGAPNRPSYAEELAAVLPPLGFVWSDAEVRNGRHRPIAELRAMQRVGPGNPLLDAMAAGATYEQAVARRAAAEAERQRQSERALESARAAERRREELEAALEAARRQQAEEEAEEDEAAALERAATDARDAEAEALTAWEAATAALEAAEGRRAAPEVLSALRAALRARLSEYADARVARVQAEAAVPERRATA